jgi:adenylate kinase
MSSFFIDRADTYLGQALVRELNNANYDGSTNTIMSARTNEQSKLYVDALLDTSDPVEFKRHLFSADVLVWDIMNTDLVAVEEAIKELNIMDLGEAEKTLILISSVLVWSGTKPKLREKGPDDPPSEDEEEEQPAADADLDEDAEKPPKFKRIPFEESDYTIRKPVPKYLPHKSLETLALATGMNKQGLNVYVVCSGVLYGKGEEVFDWHCRSAWLENPYELPYVGEGKNYVPTIHVEDLSRFVRHVVDTRPAQHYLFGIDATETPTQMSLVTAISKGLGSGKTASIERTDEAWEEHLTVDVWMRPGRFTLPPEGDEEEEEEEPPMDENSDEEGEAVKPPKPKLEWKYLHGIPANI